ncbi:unnamed protein product, partial [Ilex paraguariensis]
MAIVSGYEQDQKSRTRPSPSSATTKPFNTVLDPSNPLAYHWWRRQCLGSLV